MKFNSLPEGRLLTMIYRRLDFLKILIITIESLCSLINHKLAPVSHIPFFFLLIVFHFGGGRG